MANKLAGIRKAVDVEFMRLLPDSVLDVMSWVARTRKDSSKPGNPNLIINVFDREDHFVLFLNEEGSFPGGQRQVQFGDWVIKNPNGTFYSISDEEFIETHGVNL